MVGIVVGVNKKGGENLKKREFIIICTYKDKSRCVCKGKRGVGFDENYIPSDMIYASYSSALNGLNAFRNQNNRLVESYELIEI